MTKAADSSDLGRAIVVLLEEPDPGVRAAALLRLSQFAGARLWPVIQTLLESSDTQERVAAIVAAEKTRCFHLEDRIAADLSSEDARIAGAAAHAVSVLGDIRTQTMLLRMLGCDDLGEWPK